MVITTPHTVTMRTENRVSCSYATLLLVERYDHEKGKPLPNQRALGFCFLFFCGLDTFVCREIWTSLKRTEALTCATTYSALLAAESVGWDTAGAMWSSSCTYIRTYGRGFFFFSAYMCVRNCLCCVIRDLIDCVNLHKCACCMYVCVCIVDIFP